MSANETLFSRAQTFIPGGVNSPVRAFRSVGGAPVFIDHACGAYLWDTEGKKYIDYIGSWGPMILGHNHPMVVAALKAAIDKGLSFGTATAAEIEIAEEIIKLMPSIEKVRLVSSGTEAGMSAIRLARGYTKRNTIIKFEGCYHGHSDSLLVKAGSGMLTFGNPSSAGVPEGTTQNTLVLEYNNPTALRDAFKKYGDTIACVIVELIAGNMNMVPATQEFIYTIRAETQKYGALMIADEVMTGFRVALRGAQSLYNVTPDLTMLGKVIGGGLPVAAFGGRKEIMDCVAPLGPVYQAGTLSGNPVAVASGLATLKQIQAEGFYDKLEAVAKTLLTGLKTAAAEAHMPFSFHLKGGMMGLYLLDTAPCSFAEVMKADPALFGRFFHAMLERGVYLAPSIFEAGFVSAAHDTQAVQATLSAARESFKIAAQ